jgi:two-component sensor histidine kinase
VENTIDEVQELRVPYHSTENKLNNSYVQTEMLAGESKHIQDLHHKIGNQAQLVASIINLQKNHAQDLGTLKHLDSLCERVHFIAFLERFVIRYRDGRTIPLKTFTEELINEITRIGEQTNKASIKKRISEVHIQEKKAVAFGLFLFEAFGNAHKHAFLGKKNDHISVLLMPCGLGKCLVEISDNGQGYDSHENNMGIGISLMSALSHQLEGTVKTMCSNQGTTVKLVFTL